MFLQAVLKSLKFGHFHKSNFGGEIQELRSLGSGMARITDGNYKRSTSKNQDTSLFVSNLKELPGNNPRSSPLRTLGHLAAHCRSWKSSPCTATWGSWRLLLLPV